MLVGGGLRRTLFLVSAFTVGHSITLVIATLGWLAPPPEIVEPLIALSVLAVAAENYWMVGGRKERRVVTMACLGLFSLLCTLRLAGHSLVPITAVLGASSFVSLSTARALSKAS